MTTSARGETTLSALDEATRTLVRLSAIIAAGSERSVRDALIAAAGSVSSVWIEELILQSYLFAGFPRTLNAMREWRRISAASTNVIEEVRASAGRSEDSGASLERWRARGEETCRRVYGEMYERLRYNIRQLHPELDEWMIVEGYGKVLSRSALDLPRRELCIVAACMASGQERQLHSHLHGALNVGVSASVVSEVIEAVAPHVSAETLDGARMLWARVRGK